MDLEKFALGVTKFCLYVSHLSHFFKGYMSRFSISHKNGYVTFVTSVTHKGKFVTPRANFSKSIFFLIDQYFSDSHYLFKQL